MRLALLAVLISGCAPLPGRGNGQVEMVTRSRHGQRGQVRYMKSGPGTVDPAINRSFAEDEMTVSCANGRWLIDFEAEETSATGFGSLLYWKLITYHCAP